MTIEKLAEMGHEAFLRIRPEDDKYHKLPDSMKRGIVAQTEAIATAVLAEPTSDEAVRFAKEYETNIQNREGFQATPAAQAGLKLFLSDRLSSITQSKQPAADASKTDETGDDEVERVAKAIWLDEWPTRSWSNASVEEKSIYRNIARAALSAMNRGERWGVWSNEAWAVDRLTGKHITSCDKDVLRTLCRVWNENENYQWTAEVRPYPSTPQVQVSEEAVEAGARALASANRRTIPAGVTVMNAMEEPDWKPWKKHAESCLTAALPHLQRGVTK